MKRVYPKQIRDVRRLSEVLHALLSTLRQSPLQVTLRALSYETGIPEPIFQMLQDAHQQVEFPPALRAEDFHIVFANILIRYPAVRVYSAGDKGVFFVL